MNELPEIPVDEALALAESGVALIDIREQDEWDASYSPLAVLLPMSELQARIAELPSDERILIVCGSGVRSERVTAFLNQQGFDAVSVAGGMAQWPGETTGSPIAEA